MGIVLEVEKYVREQCMKYQEQAEDSYDFWKEHISYVYQESITLAKEYGADLEIVSLGALLHDIALINQVGDRRDHHINGEKIAREVLEGFSYAPVRMERVLKCVLHHRSSQNAETIEEKCVADADILAHFDNIPMLFYSAYTRNHVSLSDIEEYMMATFTKDYQDLSEETRVVFHKRYEEICHTLFPKKD